MRAGLRLLVVVSPDVHCRPDVSAGRQRSGGPARWSHASVRRHRHGNGRGWRNGRSRPDHRARDVRSPASAPGTVELRLLRIGFKPLRGPSVTVGADETKSVRIIYDAATVSLAAVNVRERETCRVQADSGLAVASLWEEARKAMLTSQLSSDEAPLFAEWIEYDRTLDSTSRIVRRQQVRTARIQRHTLFAACRPIS